MKRFRLRISGGFILLVVLFWFFDVEGLLWPTVIAAAVHELGHVSALWAVGGRIKRLSAAVWGLCIEYDGVLSPWYECLVILSGPLANFILAAAVNIAWSGCALADISLAQGLFNLLPIREMDGGRLLSLSVKNCALIQWAERLCCVMLCAFSVISWRSGHISNIMVLAAWLFFDRVLAMARNKSYNN